MVKITKEKFIEAIKDSGAIITLIANRLGVTRKSIYEYIEREKWTKELLNHEQEKIIDLAESKLLISIQNGEMDDVRWFLARRGKHRGYSEKTETEIITKGEGIKLIINEKNEK